MATKRKKSRRVPSAETPPPEIDIERIPEYYRGRFGRPLTGVARRLLGEQILHILYWQPDALVYAMEIRPGMVKDAMERTKRGHRAAHAHVLIDIVTGVYDEVLARERKKLGREPKKDSIYETVAQDLNAGYPLDMSAHLEKPITADAVRAILVKARLKRSSN